VTAYKQRGINDFEIIPTGLEPVTALTLATDEQANATLTAVLDESSARSAISERRSTFSPGLPHKLAIAIDFGLTAGTQFVSDSRMVRSTWKLSQRRIIRLSGCKTSSRFRAIFRAMQSSRLLK
jgi:hypothetical protein